MYGGGAEADFKGGQAVVRSVRTGFVGEADGGLGGIMERGGGGDIQDRDKDGARDGSNWWEDNV